MSTELKALELFERFVVAAERIADVMEAQTYEDDPDAAPVRYMDGRPVNQ